MGRHFYGENNRQALDGDSIFCEPKVHVLDTSKAPELNSLSFSSFFLYLDLKLRFLRMVMDLRVNNCLL